MKFAELSIPEKVKYSEKIRYEGKSTEALFDDIKWRQGEIQGCPISKKTPTKLTEKTLRKMCTHFQVECGLIGGGQQKSVYQLRLLGDIRNNFSTCGRCKAGALIRRKKDLAEGALPKELGIVEESELQAEKYTPTAPKTVWIARIVFKVRFLFKRGISIKEIHFKTKVPIPEIVKMIT